MSTCSHGAEWGRVGPSRAALSLPKRAHVDWNWPISRKKNWREMRNAESPAIKADSGIQRKLLRNKMEDEELLVCSVLLDKKYDFVVGTSSEINAILN